MKNFSDKILNSKLFKGIDSSKADELIEYLEAKKKDYKKGEYILHAGKNISSLGLIVSGKVLILQEDFWGNRNIISSMSSGQCFAETFACVPSSILGVSVIAETDSTIIFLNIQKLLSESTDKPSHSQIIKNLLLDMASKNIFFNEKLTHLGQRNTRAKLLSYLSFESRKHNCTEFDIPFSRQQLADYLFVERSGLSAELSKMKSEGLLDFNKNHFKLNA